MLKTWATWMASAPEIWAGLVMVSGICVPCADPRPLGRTPHFPFAPLAQENRNRDNREKGYGQRYGRAHPDYKRAFERYIRTGTAILLSGEFAVKKARPTTHYVWRTRGDGKVRASHAANNGKIFAWAKPPATGHPEEDYGCRCIAVPYTPASTEHFSFTRTNVSDSGSPCASLDFVEHYFFGGGQSVRVRDTGHLKAIVAAYRRLVLDDPKRLPAQIADVARVKTNGSIADWFKGTYPMTSIVFSIGDTTIGALVFPQRCFQMNQEANLSTKSGSRLRGCLLIVTIAVFIVLVCLTLFANVARRFDCTEMPNGFLMGRATVFSSLLSPDADVAIKYPDGTIFLRGDRKMDFWDQDSVAGEYFRTTEGRTDRYVYLNDGGLILKSEQPELYEFHYDRKMALHGSSFASSGGHVVGVLLLLSEDLNNRRSWCPTVFTWPHKAAWVWPSKVPAYR